MTFKLTIPEVGEKPNTVKDGVLMLLLDHHPQTTKQVYNKLRSRYRMNASFQAVNKSVQSLISSGVLQKEERNLSIHHEWIFKMRDFVDYLLKHGFEAKPETKEQIGEDIVSYTFHTMLDCDKFIARITINWAEALKSTDDHTLVWQGMHCWWLIGQLGEEDLYVETLKKHNVLSHYWNHGKTLLDIALSKKYYDSVGWKFKQSLEKSPDTRHNMAVFGDIILQSYYPEDIAQSINEFYQNVTDISKIDPAKIIKHLREERKITLTFLRNPVLSKKIKEEILGKMR